jgi:hypothetical protein
MFLDLSSGINVKYNYDLKQILTNGKDSLLVSAAQFTTSSTPTEAVS